MLKNSAVNAKIAKPVGPKRIENPIKVQKPLKKHEEPKEKSKSSTVAGKIVVVQKKVSTSHETATMSKPQPTSKTISSKSKQAAPAAPTMKPKISNGTTSKVVRQQPIKAIHQVQAKKPVAEKNVMNTIHNVTVASPPSMRKELTVTQPIMESLPRERTKTRTLEPEEVMILKQSKIVQETSNPAPSTRNPVAIEQKPIVVQESVAFEITFEKDTTDPKNDSDNKQIQDTSDGDYEDDFDSYESDFETESSTSSQSASTSSKSGNNSSNLSTPSESQHVFTPAKKIDDERDFDSGTYELKGVADKVQLDSIDERETHSEGQNDSGFGYINSTPSPVEQMHSTSQSIFSKAPKKTTYNKRGMELMKKINLDTMTFTLFELKPIPYDLYMKIYGHKNTNQSSSQTVGNMIDQDVQTDKKTKQTMWTQFPPQFNVNAMSNENYHQDRVGCGEGIENIIEARNSEECLLENTLKIINRNNTVRDVRSTRPIDYERLNFFLQKSAVTISGICNTSVATKDLQKPDLSLSDGFFQISINASKILNDTKVYYLYSNPRIENLLYLVHRRKVTSETDDNSLVSVWNILDSNKPIHVLSCWGLVICLEVHQFFQDVIVGGLTDGSLAVWNITESTFWHQYNGNETILVPSQIVAPTVDTKPIGFDFGCIISLKSVQSTNKINDGFNLTQIYSLHEFGMLTIWTIVKTNSPILPSESFNERKIDHRSPWSKTQLIQSNIIDIGSANLTKKNRPKSGFEKKKMYFESNLFSDAALRELHDFDVKKDMLDQSESFRCVDMEYHESGIVVATNKSFLIFISTSLSRDSLRKLFIDDSNFLHATKVKSMEDILLVGLTDGSVKVLRLSSTNKSHTFSDCDSTTKADVPLEESNFSAKSCAIQNIIKEERKFVDGGMSNDRLKLVEKGNHPNISTAVHGNRLINNQILLPAMSLNRDFVRWLDVSVNLNCMMCLCGEHLRMLNFQNFVEIRGGESHSGISFATMVFGYNNREYLINIKDDNVRVHLLQKNIF